MTVLKSGTKVVGMDIALNHSAFVELTDGELTDYWYWTTAAGAAGKSEHGHRLVLLDTKKVDKHVMAMARLAWAEGFIGARVLDVSQPDYVGIEDYAIRAEQGAHYLGEVGGIARLLCWSRGVRLRLHDPVSVKMFTAHDGTCQKDSIERAVSARWGADFSHCNAASPNPTVKNPQPRQNRTTSEDLADAFAVAQMVWTEVRLRSGHVLLSDMHAKEVQVFNRVTKTYPVSLLDREWIYNPDAARAVDGEASRRNRVGPTAEITTQISKVKLIKE